MTRKIILLCSPVLVTLPADYHFIEAPYCLERELQDEETPKQALRAAMDLGINVLLWEILLPFNT